jgi:hypothetical protein
MIQWSRRSGKYKMKMVPATGRTYVELVAPASGIPTVRIAGAQNLSEWNIFYKTGIF